MARTLTLPGFVNAHSHGFQRALRGRAAGADFWAWRETMLAEAERQTPHSVGAGTSTSIASSSPPATPRWVSFITSATTRLSQPARRRRLRASSSLSAAYGRGGLDRFRQESPPRTSQTSSGWRRAELRVGLAPHSVRACPRDWLVEIGSYAASTPLPLHVHALRQPREIEECVDEHGLRPVELLAETGCLGPRTTVVHATHADDRELDLIAEAGARLSLSDDRGRSR